MLMKASTPKVIPLSVPKEDQTGSTTDGKHYETGMLSDGATWNENAS